MPKTERWWVINEDELIEALKRAQYGDTWWVVFSELIANSKSEEVD